MHRRIQIKSEPLANQKQYGFGNPHWPARWIGPEQYDPAKSVLLAFRRKVSLAKKAKVRVHIAADQRYELYVDQQYVGRGAERSDLKNWVYESYELDLSAGEHLIVVRVWWVSATAPAPEAQQTHRPALLLFAEGEANELLSTGVAEWQYQSLPGYEFKDHDRLNSYFATGAQLVIDGGQLDLAAERGEGNGWRTPAVVGTVSLAALRWEGAPWWILRPAWLPPMYETLVHVGSARSVSEISSDNTRDLRVTEATNIAEECRNWNALLAGGGEVVIPAGTFRRIVIDLQNYYCAYPMLTCCGEGASLRLQSAESLFEMDADGKLTSKGNRDQIDGKVFRGIGISLTARAECFTYSTHSFMAGRYLELVIRTADQPLRISSFNFLETHFPFKFSARFASSDAAHELIVPIALRTIEMCSHDTSMDCPYYERLNYVGDTRLQSLVAYTAAGEERLARKCIDLFDLSRQASGLTYSRYPTRTVQTIPTFSLWWCCMVYDYALWRNDPAYVSERMRGVRAVLEYWRSRREENGLLRSPAGWNFVDWVPAWRAGVPADGHIGFSGILNLQAIYTLRKVAELEDLQGEPSLAKRHRVFADELARQVEKQFFNAKKGLFADDLSQKIYSEHAQCLAVLAGVVRGPAARKLVARMLSTKGLAQTTIYFSHYLFETLGQVGEMDALLKRLETWSTLKPNGFRTTFEMPEPTRSDCHAWGAHPVYHFLATIAGIRPAGFGFDAANIRPQLGTLTQIKGRMPHRLGDIAFDISREDLDLKGSITIPAGLEAALEIGGKRQKLHAGVNTFGGKGRSAKGK